jgi:hypothetical protein
LLFNLVLEFLGRPLQFETQEPGSQTEPGSDQFVRSSTLGVLVDARASQG